MVVVIGVAFYVFLARTRLGKAIRASAQDPTTAGLMGVNIHNVLAICFGLGLAMAGIAGTLLSTVISITTSMGLRYTVIAMIVVVLGGLGQHHRGHDRRASSWGSCRRSSPTSSRPWTMIAYYVIFVVLLLARPKGIMGK